jgi:hypothetical protein
MLPDTIYVLRALEYAELARRADDFEAREQFRRLAACWLRLAEYAQQHQPAARAMAA